MTAFEEGKLRAARESRMLATKRAQLAERVLNSVMQRVLAGHDPEEIEAWKVAEMRAGWAEIEAWQKKARETKDD